MPALTRDQVRHIARLARLSLTDEEVEKYATELTSILGYIEKLQGVHTDGIEGATQVTGQRNVLREDIVSDFGTDPDALLATSPLPITEHQIQTPSAHG